MQRARKFSAVVGHTSSNRVKLIRPDWAIAKSSISLAAYTSYFNSRDSRSLLEGEDGGIERRVNGVGQNVLGRTLDCLGRFAILHDRAFPLEFEVTIVPEG